MCEIQPSKILDSMNHRTNYPIILKQQACPTSFRKKNIEMGRSKFRTKMNFQFNVQPNIIESFDIIYLNARECFIR